MMSFILDHLPAGASKRAIEHYIQLTVHPNTFTRFDFGPEVNLEKYGQVTPPDYDLSLVTAPTALFNGNMELDVDGTDILAAQLPNVIWQEVVEHPDGW